MKYERKVFLLAWIPLVVMVCLAEIGNVGLKSVKKYRGYLVETQIPWTDAAFVILLCIFLTVLFYWMMGVEEVGS